MILKLSRWIERNVEHKRLNINETIIEISILKINKIGGYNI